LALFCDKPDDFDLVITDMTMPHMTGERLALEMMRAKPGIPVILCTGYSKQIDETSARQMGIKGFIYKPIKVSDLAATIRAVLDESITGR
jgi:DNA-binding NtrC family response regulator